MDVFVLNDQFLRENIIERYESLIWTDRYNQLGDFELVTVADHRAREWLYPGCRLAIFGSDRVMVAETADDYLDDEGRKLWKVTGRSLEKILEDRVVRPNIGASIGLWPKWEISGLPQSLARLFYQEICIDGNLDLADITGIGMSTPPVGDRIPEPEEAVWLELPPVTLLKATEDLTQPYDLGYRIVRDPDTGVLTYQIYTGYDRTSTQTDRSPVIFSPDLENLQNVTQFTTIANAKNVAYVFGNLGWPQIVYPPGVDPANAVGLDRRVLVVTVDDMSEDLTNAEANAYLQQRGQEELARHRQVSGLDGEISNLGHYQYHEHYGLGDLVEMRDSNGNFNKMLVTEHIWSSDEQGDKSYPTLTLYLHAESGSWLSWPQQREWVSMTSETWGSLP